MNKLSGRVLVAEDNIYNQRLIEHHLVKMGLSVTVVDNGKRAIDRAFSEEFDLIFMDMQMPVMGGLEAVSRLRNKNYSKPIVALTANALQEDKEKCLNAGCDDYATKPIRYDQLYQVAHQFVNANRNPDTSDPLYSIILNEHEDFEGLVVSFAQQLEPTMKKLKLAVREEEWETLTMMIHQLKGLGGGYGFPVITEMSAKIEFQLISKNFPEVVKLLNQLYDVFGRIIAGVEKNNNSRNAAGL